MNSRAANLRTLGMAAMFALLLVVTEMRYAEPVQDSDLFWHLAYAQQMLTDGTLKPDPGLYSWTPTNGRTIYCAWLGELLLYAVWQLGGFGGLFALRYLVIAAVAGLFWASIGRARLVIGPHTLLALLVLVLTAYTGSLIKPELLSLLGFHAVLYAYFGAKRAAMEGRDVRPWLYAVPCITLVWANAHGGHVLLAPLLLAGAAGEALNRRLSPGLGFSNRQYGHLLLAWALCAVAVCLTPYGLAYPLQHLSEMVASGAARPDTVWNTAYQPIYARNPLDFLSLPQIFIAMALLLLGAMVALWRRSPPGWRLDYALALGLLAYLPLSVMIVRTAYFWPALACYTLVHLAYVAGRSQTNSAQASSAQPLASPPWQCQAKNAASVLAFASLAASTAYQAYFRPEPASWLGFGIGYTNPVPEADFLARAKLGNRFYNTFDSGGYLIWRLFPQYQVMVDPRSFPYLDWFADQYDFANGRRFDEFLVKYPADVAIIDLQKVTCWINFLQAPGWRLLFYGPTAAVFARADLAKQQQGLEVAGELFELRNTWTALAAFDFSLAINNYALAWKIADQIEGNLRWQTSNADLARLQAYRQAHKALSLGDFDQALPLFELALDKLFVAGRDRKILALLRERLAHQRNAAPGLVEKINLHLQQLALAKVPMHTVAGAEPQ